MRMIRQVKKQV